MEGQAQVRLVFAGEYLEGHAPEQVRQLFGRMFNLEGDRLAAVFSGNRTVLKRAIGLADGERYVERLRKLGMRVRVEPLDGLPEFEPLATATAANAAPRLAATLAPLEEEVQCPHCGERQPKKFVLCRKCTTDIPRALAHQAEEAERARAERLAARQGVSSRYAPPSADVEHEPSGELVDPPPILGLGFEGRFGRASYINAGGAAMLALLGVMAVGGALVALLGKVGLVPIVLGGLAFIAWTVRNTALRLHDFNRSGWWVLLLLVPYLGALANLVIALWPGHGEENDYGPKPRRGNMVLALIVVGLTASVMVGSLLLARTYYNEYLPKAQRRAAERAQAAEAPPPERAPGGPGGQAFRDAYWPAANHKAFAVSSAGAYGWAVGRSSAREAISAALSDCDQRREAYTGQCRIVHVNGQSPEN